MNEQYPGGPAGGHSGGPNPFSREGAGEDAGLGPVPDPSSSEPEGYVGHPGGPGSAGSGGYEAPYAPPSGPTTPANPYNVSSASHPASPADPGHGYVPPYGATPYDTSQPYGTTQPYGGGQPGYPPNPYEAGGYNYPPTPYGIPSEQHPQGTTSLVLGILGVVLCQPAGIVGFVISSRARKEIQASPGRYNNSGMVTAGWVLGIIAMVLTSLWVIYLVVVIIAVIASGGT